MVSKAELLTSTTIPACAEIKGGVQYHPDGVVWGRQEIVMQFPKNSMDGLRYVGERPFAGIWG